MSQTTLCRNFGGKQGGHTFEGGVLAGHYGTMWVLFCKSIVLAIIESVDSICRDSADTWYMLMQKIPQISKTANL